MTHSSTCAGCVCGPSLISPACSEHHIAGIAGVASRSTQHTFFERTAAMRSKSRHVLQKQINLSEQHIRNTSYIMHLSFVRNGLLQTKVI